MLGIQTKPSELIPKNLELCSSKLGAPDHLADVFVAFLGAPAEWIRNYSHQNDHLSDSGGASAPFAASPSTATSLDGALSGRLRLEKGEHHCSIRILPPLMNRHQTKQLGTAWNWHSARRKEYCKLQICGTKIQDHDEHPTRRHCLGSWLSDQRMPNTMSKGLQARSTPFSISFLTSSEWSVLQVIQERPKKYERGTWSHAIQICTCISTRTGLIADRHVTSSPQYWPSFSTNTALPALLHDSVWVCPLSSSDTGPIPFPPISDNQLEACTYVLDNIEPERLPFIQGIHDPGVGQWRLDPNVNTLLHTGPSSYWLQHSLYPDLADKVYSTESLPALTRHGEGKRHAPMKGFPIRNERQRRSECSQEFPLKYVLCWAQMSTPTRHNAKTLLSLLGSTATALFDVIPILLATCWNHNKQKPLRSCFRPVCVRFVYCEEHRCNGYRAQTIQIALLAPRGAAPKVNSPPCAAPSRASSSSAIPRNSRACSRQQEPIQCSPAVAVWGRGLVTCTFIWPSFKSATFVRTVQWIGQQEQWGGIYLGFKRLWRFYQTPPVSNGSESQYQWCLELVLP